MNQANRASSPPPRHPQTPTPNRASPPPQNTTPRGPQTDVPALWWVPPRLFLAPQGNLSGLVPFQWGPLTVLKVLHSRPLVTLPGRESGSL